jgi:hypothetical protein
VPDTPPETVADRTPNAPVVLSDIATSLLTEASGGGSGTAATSLTPGRDKSFTQTLVAVTSGNQLDPGHWNGPASLQIITGSAAVVDEGGRETIVGVGEWTPLGSATATVRAEEDVVGLLTVAPEV